MSAIHSGVPPFQSDDLIAIRVLQEIEAIQFLQTHQWRKTADFNQYKQITLLQMASLPRQDEPAKYHRTLRDSDVKIVFRNWQLQAREW